VPRATVPGNHRFEIVLRRQWSNYKDVYRSAEPKPHREDGNSKEKEKEKKKSTIHPGQMNYNHRVEFKKVPVTP
jgi:hypothetical protein